MSKLLIQFERELWESRASLLRTPIILSGILVALLLLGMITTQQNVQGFSDAKWDLDFGGDEITGSGSEFMELLFSGDLFQVHPRILTTSLASIQTIFVLVLLLIIPSYLLGSLYTDRRDQSILFWKSLPVTETQSVLTKLGTVVLLGPAIYFLAALITGAIYLVLLLMYGALMFNLPLPGFGVLVSAVVGSALTLVVAWLLLALWFLPVFSWLMLASAVAKKAPFLWAAGLPLGAVVLEAWIFGSNHLGGVISGHIGSGLTAFVAVIQGLDGLPERLNSGLLSPALFSGLAVCALFIAASVWLRNNRYEI
jgi:ABC-2 type transport system permease protein